MRTRRLILGAWAAVVSAAAWLDEHPLAFNLVCWAVGILLALAIAPPVSP